MFGHRNDGKKVKGLNIIDKAEPFFMPQRIDAVNYTAIKVPCDKLDEFIQREKRSGNSYSYMHIFCYYRQFWKCSRSFRFKLSL